MTNTQIKTFALGTFLAAATLAPVLTVTTAEAGGRGKEFFSQTYRTAKPLHGFEGRAGDYYCSYIRVPISKPDANGRLKVVAWELQQHCY